MHLFNDLFMFFLWVAIHWCIIEASKRGYIRLLSFFSLFGCYFCFVFVANDKFMKITLCVHDVLAASKKVGKYKLCSFTLLVFYQILCASMWI